MPKKLLSEDAGGWRVGRKTQRKMRLPEEAMTEPRSVRMRSSRFPPGKSLKWAKKAVYAIEIIIFQQKKRMQLFLETDLIFLKSLCPVSTDILLKFFLCPIFKLLNPRFPLRFAITLIFLSSSAAFFSAAELFSYATWLSSWITGSFIKRQSISTTLDKINEGAARNKYEAKIMKSRWESF